MLLYGAVAAESPHYVATEDAGGSLLVIDRGISDRHARMLEVEPRKHDHILHLTRGDRGQPWRVRRFADGFESISAMLGHGGKVHVISGPTYQVLADDNGDGVADRRSIVSSIEPPPIETIHHSMKDLSVLHALLVDRARSNQMRIEAMWIIRRLTIPTDAADQTASSEKPTDPTPWFITALHNGPDELRAEAARVLRVAPEQSKPAIKGLIHRAKNDRNAKVRLEAAITLGHLRAIDGVAELFGSLDDADDAARFAKIMAIRAINEWDFAPAFINAADPRIREGAMLALLDIRNESAIDALAFALRSSPYVEMRLAAIKALERSRLQTVAIPTTDRPATWTIQHFRVSAESSLTCQEALRSAIHDDDEEVANLAAKMRDWIAHQAYENTERKALGVSD